MDWFVDESWKSWIPFVPLVASSGENTKTKESKFRSLYPQRDSLSSDAQSTITNQIVLDAEQSPFVKRGCVYINNSSIPITKN
jgi:hypothetical protein